MLEGGHCLPSVVSDLAPPLLSPSPSPSLSLPLTLSLSLSLSLPPSFSLSLTLSLPLACSPALVRLPWPQYASTVVDQLFLATTQVPCAQEAWKLFRYVRQRGTPVAQERLRECLKVRGRTSDRVRLRLRRHVPGARSVLIPLPSASLWWRCAVFPFVGSCFCRQVTLAGRGRCTSRCTHCVQGLCRQ